MFYAHFVLAKKGPLARIWLAAHWDKKLTKAHVFETNIESSVEGILQPKVKMALRTSGHLLLGIVRIYSRKAKYLLADCNEAFIKIKIAFRPGVVDLPEGNREASVASITLPEVFHDFDTALPDITIDMDAQVSLNQSRAEDITLKEDYGNLSLMNDDGFDDNMGFDEVEDGRGGAFDDNGLFFSEEPSGQEAREDAAAGVSNTSIISKPKSSFETQLKDDGFGGTVGEGLLDGETGGLFEPAGLFDDAPLGEELDSAPAEQPPVDSHQIQEKPLEQHAAEEDSDDDMYDAPCSMGAPSPPSSPESPAQPLNEAPPQDIPSHPTDLIEGPRPQTPLPTHSDPPSDPHMPPMPPQEEMAPPPPVPPIAALDHTTLINNDAESFALAPLDAMIAHGSERTVKAKRKRKLVVDEVKSISGEEMKSQLSDTTDIVATLDLAPPTKRLMHWKETGGVEKLFSLPGHRILSKTLTRSYLRHLTTRSVENEDDQEEIDLQPTNYQEKDLPKEDESISFEKERDPSMENVHKRQRLDSDASHLDSYHSRPSYLPDHSSLPTDASSIMGDSFLHSFDPLQPPTSMISHYPDMQQLPQIPQIIDPMNNQGPSLQSITPSIQSEVLPPDHHSVIEPIAHHLDHIQRQQLQQHLPVDHHMHQMPPPSTDFISPAENIPEQHPRAPMNGQNMIDDDATQPLMEQYPQAPIVQQQQQQQLPIEEVPSVANLVGSEAQIPNGPEQPITTEQNAFDQLFDHIQPQTSNQMQQEPQTSGTLNDAELEINRTNEFMGSDDEDNYEAPASVGPVMPEEQQADETYEQFEERILTKRTTHLLHVVHDALDNDRNVSFANLVRNNKRKQVAQKFYTFLVLKKQQAVELEHDSLGDLIITKGPKYDLVYNGN